jgi:hypothetical protein
MLLWAAVKIKTTARTDPGVRNDPALVLYI